MNDLINTLSSAIHSISSDDASVKKKNKVDVSADLLKKVEAVAQQLKGSPTAITTEDAEKLRLCAQELESVDPLISSTALPKLNALISKISPTEVQSSSMPIHEKITTTVATIAPLPDRLYEFSEDEIKETVQRIPELPKNIPIEKLFKQKLNKKEIEDELNGIIRDFGLQIEDFSPEDRKTLFSLLFVAKSAEISASQRSNVKFLLTKNLLSTSPIKQLKDQPAHEERATALQTELFTRLGISIRPENATSALGTLKELLFIRSIMKNGSIAAKEINKQIYSILATHFTTLCSELDAVKKQESDEGIKDRVMSLMGILHYLSGGIAYEERDNALWINITENYMKILQIKATSGKKVNQIIADVLQEFHSLIDDGISAYLYLHGEGMTPEEFGQMVYGMTAEQLEDKKAKNRKEVAQLIPVFAEQIRSGAPLTLEMISELNRVNNQGILPTRASRLREGESDQVAFGVRKGLSPESVKPALKAIVDEMNDTIAIHAEFSMLTLWAIFVAKFHNDFLDIHPFKDRNGSTALLLTELLMAVGGDYKPAPTRGKDYYETLYGILESSAAVAIVAYEHYRIAHVPGSYQFTPPSEP